MRDDDEEKPAPADAFFLPEEGDDDPRPIVHRLVHEQQIEDFLHLRMGEAVVMVVMRADAKHRNGKAVLGEMALPRFQGGMGAFALWLLAKACGGALPDFLLILDAAWWRAASPHQREALVFHELRHADHARDKEGSPKFDDDGNPVWGIAPHDLEEFSSVVARYGAYLPDITDMAAAMLAGGVL